MIKNKPANKVRIELLDPKSIYEDDITEEAIEILLKTFPEYYAAVDQSGVALANTIEFGRDDNEYDDEALYCLYREFDRNKSPRGRIKVYVSEEHMKKAVLLAEMEEMTEDLPPPPKKRSKSKGIL
ncbi:MAG: hypothetical protein V4650_05995 [Pseudomonadota bacterium]